MQYKAVVMLVLILAQPVSGQEVRYSFDMATGYVYNRGQTLTVKQNGQDDIEFDAEFETKPFNNPMYYTMRIGRWQQAGAWEFELIHHKLYVDNLPPEIQKFEITDGFNLLLANRTWLMDGWIDISLWNGNRSSTSGYYGS